MWSGIVVIEKIPLQNSSKMLFGKYNHVVKTLATDTADYSLRVRVLPGRVGSGDNFFDPHSSYPPLKIVPVDRISVSQQEAWSRVFRVPYRYY